MNKEMLMALQQTRNLLELLHEFLNGYKMLSFLLGILYKLVDVAKKYNCDIKGMKNINRS